MNPTVLFVDDEPAILKALQRVFIDAPFTFRTAADGLSALKLIGRERVDVIVADNQMPQLSGVNLLARIRKQQPGIIRILLTGFADKETAVAAITQGDVYRIIVKPWDETLLVDTVEEAVMRAQLVGRLQHAEGRDLLAVAEEIELRDPFTKGHCTRVAGYALQIADALDLDKSMRHAVEQGAWLHDIGKIEVPAEILSRVGALTSGQRALVKQHPRTGAQLARHAALDETVTAIIRYHHEHFDGSGYPCGVSGQDIPVAARIVAVSDVFEALTSERPFRKAFTPPNAKSIMAEQSAKSFDPTVLQALWDALS